MPCHERGIMVYKSFAFEQVGGVIPNNFAAFDTLNQIMDTLADSIAGKQPQQWLQNIEEIRRTAHHFGCSTVEMMASALESEIAHDGCVRTMTCYLEAMADAFDMDFSADGIPAPALLRQNQEALLASLALRMHG